MTWIMVDIEADGPAPGLYSMISFGAVSCYDRKQTFYGKIKPISDKWVPGSLAVSGFTREQTLAFPEPMEVMTEFDNWLTSQCNGSRPRFISDNNSFDFQFINYYFWAFLNRNPFGHSSTNLGSLAKGAALDFKFNMKKFRKTQHSHNPVDDAMGNVEAFEAVVNKFNIKNI